jgi:hypothetical protein
MHDQGQDLLSFLQVLLSFYHLLISQLVEPICKPFPLVPFLLHLRISHNVVRVFRDRSLTQGIHIVEVGEYPKQGASLRHLDTQVQYEDADTSDKSSFVGETSPSTAYKKYGHMLIELAC